MNPRSLITFTTVFALGIIVGFFTYAIKSGTNKKNKADYAEKHEGQSGFVNPLLACDVASDVLSDLELPHFKNNINEFIRNRMDKRWATKVGVYFRELNDGYWFSIGDMEQFTPASLRKVPLMIALLKQVEKEAGLLDRMVKFDLANDYNLNQNIRPSQTLIAGNSYTIKDLIYRMIVYSDNNAFTFLTKIVDPVQFDKVYTDLRILNPGTTTDDQYLSIQTYESFFRILYNCSYLDRHASEWALDILSRSEFKTGLVAGVPPNVKVSHKFGEKSDSSKGLVELHDCGIVYYPKHPYLLCIMSQGSNFEYLDDVIANISQITFSAIDAQHQYKK